MIMKEEFEIHADKEMTECAKLQSQSTMLSTRSQTLLSILLKTDSQSEANKILPQFLEALKQSKDADFQYGIMAGKVMTDKAYIDECNEKIRAAGGEKAVKEFLAYGVIEE